MVGTIGMYRLIGIDLKMLRGGDLSGIRAFFHQTCVWIAVPERYSRKLKPDLLLPCIHPFY